MHCLQPDPSPPFWVPKMCPWWMQFKWCTFIKTTPLPLHVLQGKREYSANNEVSVSTERETDSKLSFTIYSCMSAWLSMQWKWLQAGRGHDWLKVHTAQVYIYSNGVRYGLNLCHYVVKMLRFLFMWHNCNAQNMLYPICCLYILHNTRPKQFIFE